MKEIIDTYLLAADLKKSKKQDEEKLDANKEKCENYYCCDDIENDKRGSY